VEHVGPSLGVAATAIWGNVENLPEVLMRENNIARWVVLTVSAFLCLTTIVFAANSPDDRQPTDPKSIVSVSSTSAHPVPINDLFYSRRVSSSACSPNEKAPLLVLQGENDIRVPKEEAEQVVEILKKEGRTVDAHYYPGEGHGFSKRENQIDSMRRTVEWFDKYLKGVAATQPGTQAVQ
jgi:acetyl esterase/lipase